MTPRAVLLKTSLTPFNTVRPVNTAHPKPVVHSAKSMSHFSKQAQSTAQRPFYKQTTLTSRYVNTAMRHYHTERPRAGNTARSYTGPVNAVRAKRLISNESACTQGEFNASTSTQKEEISQDYIVMPIWKDASYFDSPSKDVGHGEPKTSLMNNSGLKCPDNENDEKDKF
ncbi:hypothetical protein Tco_0955705 [Tanacetum coccineum]|uniref:Uncharacterized protein n=1 Tax=Tanacetum coccineum TaxID=301880 RepID=A0ABQ5E800_9ASTR